MPNLLTWHVGNRNPSIIEEILVGSLPFNLSSSTVRFKMRLVGSIPLKVDELATVTDAINGVVRYDWLAVDVDTPGNYLCWWEVETASKKQDMGEALIQILAHAPVSRDYVELEEFKKTIALDGLSFADLDVKKVLSAASRKIDSLTERRFYPDADATQERVYSPANTDRIWIDDLVTLTTLKTDPGGDGTYEDVWIASDYVLEPVNAAANDLPWSSIRVRPASSFYFPIAYSESVEITGKFGWESVPEPISLATTMLAHRYLKRVRESPTGVAGFGADGTVVRFQTVDSDVMDLISAYSRRVLVA